MILSDLISVCSYVRIELHSSYDGKLIATSNKSLEKYSSVQVKGIVPKMKLNNEGTYCSPYLYVYVSPYDIYNVNREINYKCIKSV